MLGVYAYAHYSPKSPPARAVGLFGCSSQGWHPGLFYAARLRGLLVRGLPNLVRETQRPRDVKVTFLRPPARALGRALRAGLSGLGRAG